MAPPKRNRASGAGPAKENLWAIKKADGEMFTRSDIQYDVMLDIFNDTTFQFTSPVDRRPLSFRDLYIETLSYCSRAARNTIRQLEEQPTWALNFAIASFLINIGKINTTVAFYPELRAYMRTYHPIPCLQPDEFCRANLQDAPRIKTMLKSCVLPFETGSEGGNSLVDIAKRSAQGFRPPTTIVTLIFEMFNVEQYISSVHFPEGYTLHDLFSPTGIPTKLRAYAFLWLVHHYLEDPTAENDFGPNPEFHPFELIRGAGDNNVDPEDELAWGREMQAFRLEFLKKWKGEEAVEEAESAAAAQGTPMTKRQKAIAQNYAHAVEAENSLHQHESKGRVHDPRQPYVYTAREAPLSSIHEVSQNLAKLEASVPGPQPSAFDQALRRAMTDIATGRDAGYDSEDDLGTFWTVSELKGRLVGFAFPGDTSDGEELDTVVRFGRKHQDVKFETSP